MNHETSRVNINFTTEASTTDILVSNSSSLNYALVPPNHYQLLLLLVITLLLAGCIIFSNSVIIAAMFRYKRLRTASNYFIMSLALSDLWTGIFLPICVFLQNTIITWLCILPYCIIIVLVTASVLVMTAIAVDRFTSLVQPLRYNNLITHSSVERYIASFWVYSCIIGTTPIIYIQCYVVKEGFHDTQCSFYNIIDKTLQTFLFFTVYGPCSVILLTCYCYIYIVARYHARAIYSIEISLRQNQNGAHSRYGQTLAITVGLFISLWAPYQVCILIDFTQNTSILDNKQISTYLVFPIFVSSAVNPWVYGYRNSELRAAMQKVINDVIAFINCKTTHHYQCPELLVTGINHETAELNSFASNVRLCAMSPIRCSTHLVPHPEEIDTSLTTIRENNENPSAEL
ncbi:hypothetical protein M8J76_001195 [Diaphorina citri]|nr:hypothetical protein M8J75_008907 [Diaphorina citri]KAI5740168.1 hypothetical protein M8J76_001195 [Diaphorina citri]